MPHMKAAFDRIDQLAEIKFKDLGIKNMLYVGWRHDCHPWWHKKLAPALGAETVGLLEIFPPNISDAEQKIWNGYFNPLTVEVTQGDVRNVDALFRPGDYDVVYWDHGPEHVTFEDLKKVTPSLLQLSKKLLIYSCPWGSWPQDASDGNEHERHLWDVTPRHMDELGMMWDVVGGSGQQNGGEIIAWRIK